MSARRSDVGCLRHNGGAGRRYRLPHGSFFMGLADPKMMARLADVGGIAIGGSPADFGKYIADETEKWAKVIRAGNIKAE